MTTEDMDPDDENPTRDFVEAFAETFDAAQVQMTERQAAAIAEVNQLGLAWHKDPYLAPWCRHLGSSMGRVAADLLIGFPLVRVAYKALATTPSTTDFVTTLLAAHPDASDPKLQRELLAEGELSYHCIRKVMEMVAEPDNRVAAVHKFIDTIIDALVWMFDQATIARQPATH